jgi:hypothetical protein
MQIHPVGAQLFHVGGRADIMDLIFAFHNYAKASNKWTAAEELLEQHLYFYFNCTF